MANLFAFMVLLARLVLSKEDELLTVDRTQLLLNNKDSSSYSFGYGVSDAHTGDVKTVWESKEGDTVKGHYSVLEADGSVRTVEYSASPGKGFTAAVNSDGRKTQTPVTDKPKIENKSSRDYHNKPYDYSEDLSLDFYPSNDGRNKKRPHDSYYKEYSTYKRPTYGGDSELGPPDFPYNLPSKHSYDDGGYNREIHRHIGFTHDNNCKTKHTKDNSHVYKNPEDLDFRRHKNPFQYTNLFNYDKYFDSYNEDADKFTIHNPQRYKVKGKPDEIGLSTSLRYSNPVLPDVPPSENLYHDDIIQRPRKKYRPHKEKQSYYSHPSDDLSDYVLVPKKKLKKPRVPDINDYPPDMDEDYDNTDYDDDRNHKPHRGVGQKDVVRKIVMKKRPPIMKFLDVLDI